MKRITIFLILFVLLSLSLAETAEGQQSWKMLLDSTSIYKWDQSTQVWILSGKDKYYYDSENRLMELKQFNTSGDLLRIELRSYTDSSMIRILKIPVNDSFVNWRKYLTVYNEMQKENYAETYVWVDDDWIRADKVFYFYDDNRLVQLIRQYLYNGVFQNVSKTEYIYDNYYLIEILGTNVITNTPLSRILYSYNELNQRAEGLIYSWSSDVWSINGKQVYNYNNCGQLKEIINQNYPNNIFINTTKTQYFYSPHFLKSNEKKAPVCHNRHTIYVSKNALNSHLAHGDCIGECTVEKQEEKDIKGQKNSNANIKPPFTVFPNPAAEMIIIRFDVNDEQTINETRRIELIDFYGKLIKSFNVKGNSDLTINRDGLPDGKYYIRLTGKEVFSIVIIFE